LGREFESVAIEMFNLQVNSNHYPKKKMVTRLGKTKSLRKYGFDMMADFGTTDTSKIGQR
jgi:hypothetical protein